MNRVTPAELVAVARKATFTYLHNKPSLSWQRDDMLGDAMLSAHVAYQRWDGSGVFAGYAYPRVVFGIIDGLRSRSYLTRKAYADFGGQLDTDSVPPAHLVPLHLTYDDLTSRSVADPHAEDPYRHFEARMTVPWMLSLLRPREREVIRRVDLGGELQADVARDFGVTEPRISQLRSVALWRLRNNPDVREALL